MASSVKPTHTNHRCGSRSEGKYIVNGLAHVHKDLVQALFCPANFNISVIPGVWHNCLCVFVCYVASLSPLCLVLHKIFSTLARQDNDHSQLAQEYNIQVDS